MFLIQYLKERHRKLAPVAGSMKKIGEHASKGF
jgi:hypothetical protein